MTFWALTEDWTGASPWSIVYLLYPDSGQCPVLNVHLIQTYLSSTADVYTSLRIATIIIPNLVVHEQNY